MAAEADLEVGLHLLAGMGLVNVQESGQFTTSPPCWLVLGRVELKESGGHALSIGPKRLFV